jgi:carbon monoxide dehydrogenase subunit G
MRTHASRADSPSRWRATQPRVVSVVDIARPPEAVFCRLASPARLGDWQPGVISTCMVGDGPPAVGTIWAVTARLGGSTRTVTSVITQISPPRTLAIRGVDGAIRATVKVTVEPRQGGQHSHVRVSLDLSAYGMGRLLLPMAVRRARRHAPQICQRLKQQLENAG